MGLFADTLADATRPLPHAALRRMADASPAPSGEPEPRDEGDALTVYRLQKDGGAMPPAPPAPRAADAAATAHGPLRAPVGDFDVDASLQFVTSIDGLETGKGQASSRKVGVTDEQEPLVSPDSSHRFHYAAAAGSSAPSNLAPSPHDQRGDLVQRIDSSDGMRRATGRGAPSGDPFVAAAPTGTAAAAGIDAAMPAEAAPPRPGTPTPGGNAPPPRVEAAIAVETAARAAAPRPHAGIDAAAARPAPQTHATASPASIAPSPRSGTPADNAPRLSIGRIEVTVVSAPQPVRAPGRPSGDDAFLSRHYLRRL